MNKLALLVLALSVSACRGDLLATAKLTGPGSAEAHFSTAKQVEFWAAFDGKWEAHSYSKYAKPPLEYQIEASQAGNVIARIHCDTSGRSSTRSCSNFVRIGSSFSGDCEFKLTCEAPELREGEVTLKVTGMLPEPERIKDVKDMSLNVRAR